MTENIENKVPERQVKHNPGEFIFSLFLEILAVVFLINSGKLSGVLQGDPVGPGVMPQVISMLLLICNTIILIKLIKDNCHKSKLADILKHLYAVEVLSVSLISVLYCILLGKVQFYILTGTYIFSLMFAIERKKIIFKLIITLIVMTVYYLIFGLVFKIVWP